MELTNKKVRHKILKMNILEWMGAVALERRVDVTKLNLLVIKLYLATLLSKITGSLIV